QPGSHKVTVRDSVGCTFPVPFEIKLTASTLSATADTVNARCPLNTGSVTINATGGTGSYSYSLDGGNFVPGKKFETLQQGSHKVTVRDSIGCTFEVSFEIKLAAATLNATPDPVNATCTSNTGSVTINATGGGIGGYSY